MPIRMNDEQLHPRFGAALAAAPHPPRGMWLSTGSTVVAEICAGSGIDWLLIDTEHGPSSLESVQLQLQALAAYPPPVIVRVPDDDPVGIKRMLDIGATTLLVPMVDSPEQAAQVVAATKYPPEGIRGIGAALARSSRWGRIPGYLDRANDSVEVIVQIESARAVEQVEQIVAVPGIAGVFVGPSDLAGSMGHLGEQGHADVVAAVEHCLRTAAAHSVPAGVNAFAPDLAQRYVEAGARFVCVGADVLVLARGAAALAS